VQSQHYIKRLCGVPGDSLEIKKNGGPLYVNGEIATEDGIAKVFDEYDGYSLIRKVRVPDYQGINKTKLPKDSYFALGDNSDDSADSRMWGNVPEDNLLGPGLMVYWPLEHWGLMK
jgi:signal peptidase I